MALITFAFFFLLAYAITVSIRKNSATNSNTSTGARAKGQFNRTKVSKKQLTQRALPPKLAERTYAMIHFQVPGMGNISIEDAVKERNADRKANGQVLIEESPIVQNAMRTQALLLASSASSNADTEQLFTDERFKPIRDQVDRRLRFRSLIRIRGIENRNEAAFMPQAGTDNPPPFSLPDGTPTLPIYFTVWVPEKLVWSNEYDSGSFGSARMRAPLGARGELSAGLYDCRVAGLTYASHERDCYSYGSAIVFRQGYTVGGVFDNERGHSAGGPPPITQTQLITAIEQGEAIVYASCTYENQISALLVPRGADEAYVRNWFADLPRQMSSKSNSDPQSDEYKQYDMDPLIASIDIQNVKGSSASALDAMESAFFAREGDTEKTRTWMSFYYHPDWGVVRDTDRHLKWRKRGRDQFEGVINN